MELRKKRIYAVPSQQGEKDMRLPYPQKLLHRHLPPAIRGNGGQISKEKSQMLQREKGERQDNLPRQSSLLNTPKQDKRSSQEKQVNGEGKRTDAVLWGVLRREGHAVPTKQVQPHLFLNPTPIWGRLLQGKRKTGEEFPENKPRKEIALNL